LAAIDDVQAPDFIWHLDTIEPVHQQHRLRHMNGKRGLKALLS
jgi:hypothetical protein